MRLSLNQPFVNVGQNASALYMLLFVLYPRIWLKVRGDKAGPNGRTQDDNTKKSNLQIVNSVKNFKLSGQI